MDARPSPDTKGIEGTRGVSPASEGRSTTYLAVRLGRDGEQGCRAALMQRLTNGEGPPSPWFQDGIDR